MKKTTYNINMLIVQYNKYVKKLKQLQLARKNFHRQGVLEKHISKLSEKLNSLLLNSKQKLAMAAITSVMVLGANSANAQEFNNGNASGFLTNPFGLDTASTYARRPVLVDLDNDGDLDIWDSQPGNPDAFIENTGNATTPAFIKGVDNAFGLSITSYGYATFADIDNDGDMDYFTGSYGSIVYVENKGTASVPDLNTISTPSVTLLAGSGLTSSNKAPTFVDIDGDGDLDLFIGDNNSNILYFENTGTVSSYNFGALQTNPFNISIGTDIRPILAFTDLDSDGDLDLLVGVRNGDFLYLENTGTTSAPSFGAPQTNPFSLANSGSSTFAYAAPTFGDLDNDGDMDMISSDYSADFFYYENTSSLSTGINTENIQLAVNIFPNPTTGQVTFTTEETIEKIEIFNTTGKKIAAFNNVNTIDISNFNSGIYFVKITTQNNSIVQRVIKQ